MSKAIVEDHIGQLRSSNELVDIKTTPMSICNSYLVLVVYYQSRNVRAYELVFVIYFQMESFPAT